MGFSVWQLFNNDLAIDLGTANTLIHVKNKGILLNEPSVIAVRRDNYQVLAVGHEAKVMWGKTPEEIITVRPMKDGVIADFDLAEMMIKKFIQKVQIRRYLHPLMTVSIPSGITEVERRAVRDSGEHAGAREVESVRLGSVTVGGRFGDQFQCERPTVCEISGIAPGDYWLLIEEFDPDVARWQITLNPGEQLVMNLESITRSRILREADYLAAEKKKR